MLFREMKFNKVWIQIWIKEIALCVKIGDKKAIWLYFPICKP